MDLDVTAWLALGLQLAAYYLFPLALWAFLTRRLEVGWRWVGLGALTWLTALPALLVIPMGAMYAVGDPARTQLVWGATLSVTAGIVEESSRYLYYRYARRLRDPDGRRFAIAAGAGHGGTEALVLGLQLAVAPVLGILLVPEQMPAEWTSSAVASYALIGGGSRIVFVVGHVGFALMVWRAVARARIGWLAAAIVGHIGLDLLAFVVPALVPGTDWLVVVPTVALVAFAIHQIAGEIRGSPQVARSAT